MAENTLLAQARERSKAMAATPVLTERRVGVIGDSITANGGYVRELNRVCEKYNINFSGYGVVNNRTDQMLARFQREIASGGYNEVVIFGGVNDIASDRAMRDITHDLSEMYRAARERGIRIIAVTVTPWAGYGTSTPQAQRRTLQLNEWIREQQRIGNVDVVVDGYAALEQQGTGRLKDEFRGDGLHPNPAGQRALGLAIYNAAYRR